MLRLTTTILMATLAANAADHVVRSGDTLGTIAQQYRVPVAAIQSVNGITDANKIRIGQKISVPDSRNKADWSKFVAALRMVESSNRRRPRDGDHGQSIGPLQIQMAYWRDAVDHDPSIGGRYEDCRTWDYSVKVVRAYLSLYAAKSLASEDWEACARIHNGGPAGNRLLATVTYWRKVSSQMYE